MPAQPSNLLLLQDLEDSGRTKKLPDNERNGLRSVADWITTVVARPNKDLGRSGPICPFVVGALERKTLWLAPEQIANQGVGDIVQLVHGYRKLLVQARPIQGDAVQYKAIVVVLADSSADRVNSIANEAPMRDLMRRLYAEDGVVLGVFQAKNDASAIHNASFQPFKAPVPFFLLRPAVISDWKFFVDDADWLRIWAHRFGESAVLALAEELRRTNWRQLTP